MLVQVHVHVRAWMNSRLHHKIESTFRSPQNISQSLLVQSRFAVYETCCSVEKVVEHTTQLCTPLSASWPRPNTLGHASFVHPRLWRSPWACSSICLVSEVSESSHLLLLLTFSAHVRVLAVLRLTKPFLMAPPTAIGEQWDQTGDIYTYRYMCTTLHVLHVQWGE